MLGAGDGNAGMRKPPEPGEVKFSAIFDCEEVEIFLILQRIEITYHLICDDGGVARQRSWSFGGVSTEVEPTVGWQEAPQSSHRST